MKNGEHMKWGFLKRTSMMILFKRSDDEPFYLKTRFLKLPVESDAVEIGNHTAYLAAGRVRSLFFNYIIGFRNLIKACIAILAKVRTSIHKKKKPETWKLGSNAGHVIVKVELKTQRVLSTPQHQHCDSALLQQL
jgi:hypothetical protein